MVMKNILFCGYGKLGTNCIKKLIEDGYNISYVFTHKEFEYDSVDTFAKRNKINYSYEDIRKSKDEFKRVFLDMNLDYLVSINYRYIIPREIFTVPKYSLNIHGSLLPKYRGRTPHVWSIINGEEYSGITCHLIDEGIDTGNIIEQISVKIEENDTGYTLLKKFEKLYPDLLIKSIDKLDKNCIAIIQDENNASYFGKRTPDMGYIDFYKKSFEIVNFVRAQAFPYPGAYYYLSNGKKIIINKIIPIGEEYQLSGSIGVIKSFNNEYYVKCIDSTLKIVDFQIK
ncbi:methionyl-tRNA formyltransferase [Clostridium sporogenes]|nr:methionyl-tRNA formyltransferase [Clostridium sporogenes]NFS24557.1 methionyl-tRNA formyltransferase [Clostridium sporogenes]